MLLNILQTGDICNPENIEAFAGEVRQDSPLGVNLVVADGVSEPIAEK